VEIEKHPNDNGAAMDLAFGLGLTSMKDVQTAWNEVSGESITRAMVWKICKRAEAKLRRELSDLQTEL
jgi:glycerol kinase